MSSKCVCPSMKPSSSANWIGVSSPEIGLYFVPKKALISSSVAIGSSVIDEVEIRCFCFSPVGFKNYEDG